MTKEAANLTLVAYKHKYLDKRIRKINTIESFLVHDVYIFDINNNNDWEVYLKLSSDIDKSINIKDALVYWEFA